MRRYIIDDEKYFSKTKKYDSEASDSSPGSFRIRRHCQIKSFGNDIGCQYERPGRNLSRNKRKTQSVTEPQQRYIIESHEIGMSKIPAFVYNDVARPYMKRPSPIMEGYEPSYADDERRYVTLQKMPKFVYKSDRLSSWTQVARPIETRYFTEDPRSHRNAYLNQRSSTSNGSGPIVEARYITDSTRVPKLVTDLKCRMMVDASVGMMPPKKKVTKIYLPEMRNRGTGSTDLTPQIPQLKAQRHQAIATTSCGYETPVPVHFSRRPQVFSAKLLPNVNLVSANTSAMTANLTETSAQFSEHIENVDDIPEKLVEKNQDFSSELRSQDESPEVIPESKIESKPGLLDVVSLKSSNIDKEPPSELIKLYDLENISEQGRIANSLKAEVQKDFFKMYATNSKDAVVTNESKKSIASPIPKLESTSEVRRRFEALRKVVVEKDDPIHDNLVSRATSHISFERKHAAVSPGISPQRSYSSTNIDDCRFDYQYSEPSSSPKSKRRDGMYKFKLWGHKRNEIEFKQGKEQSPRKKAESQSRPLKIQEPEYTADKKKSRRLFFFSKKSKIKDRYQQDRNRQRITSARCDVPGVSLKIGGTQYLHQMRGGKQLDTIKNAWLEQFMLGVIDSTEDVHIRWNNGCFNTSSTTVLELMDSVYEGAGVVVKSKSHESQVSVHKNDDKRVNFFQNIEAYMVHKTIQKPYKLRRNSQTTRSNDKWYYENPQTIARKIELVMTANDISVFRHSTKGSSSSEDLKIELPNNFCDEMTSEEQVYNVIEYEDLESIPDLPHKKKIVTMDKGDIVVIPISGESSEQCHSRKKFRDVVLRDSSILAPKRCDFISLLMQRTKRRSRNLQSQLQIYDDEDRRESDRTTILQEVYRSWLEKFTWFGKDDRSCHSDEVDFHGLRQLYIIEEESSIQSKSCPTLFEFQEYQLTPKLSIVDISQEAEKDEEETERVETKPRENVAKKITDKIFSVFKKNDQDSAIRILPKDSVAVCRKRMKMAASLRRWQEGDLCDGPCSVPSHADKAGEIQWDIDDIPLLSKKLPKEVIGVPTSILAEASKTDKKKKSSKPTIDPIPSGVIPREYENSDQPSSEELEKETAVVLPVSEAESTGVKPTGVYCMPNTNDPDCLVKANLNQDLNTFRRQMRALGTPLPMPDSSDFPSIATGKNISKHISGNILYQAEYQFQPKPVRRSQQIDQDTSYDEPTDEDMKNLEDKLVTLSHTTTKSLEVLTQIYQEDEEQEENQQIVTKRDSIIVSSRRNSRQVTCECSKPSCEPICSIIKDNEYFPEEHNPAYIVRRDPSFQRKRESFAEDKVDRKKSSHLIKYERPPTFKTDTIAERCKYNNGVKSFPEAGKCSMCSHCPNCSNAEGQISTNSAMTSPIESMLQKNKRLDDSEPNAPQQTQFPISRSLATGVSHDENVIFEPETDGHNSELQQRYSHYKRVSEGELKRKSEDIKLNPCSGQCNRYLSPTSQHELEVSPSVGSRRRSSRQGSKLNRLPSNKDEQESLEQEDKDRKASSAHTYDSYRKASDRVSLKSKWSRHDAGTGSKTSLRSTSVTKSARDASEKKCIACIPRPWWLGGAGIPKLPTLPAKCIETESKSPTSSKPSPATSEKKDPSAPSSGIYRRKSKTTTTSIYNMIEDRLKTLTAEDTEQTYSIRDEFMEKFSKLEMPRIIEIDSKETILVGNKRKTPSTEQLRDLESPKTVRRPKFAAPKTNLPSEPQNKYIPLEMNKDSDQIEISFRVKIGSGVTENIDNSYIRHRYKTQPEVYVLGNQHDKTDANETPNDVNIQIIIKPHRSEHNLSLNNTHDPKKPRIHTDNGTSRTYSVNRSATELSIQKEESENTLKVKWEPNSEGKSTETSLNSEGSSKEQKNLTSNQRAIKPVNRTVASPFKVMYKTPLTDQEEENTRTELVGMRSPVGIEKFCTCGRSTKDTTQVNTRVTTGTDSMKNYFRDSALSDDEIYPSKSSANSTCSGPYKERIKTLNSDPKSKLIQTYTKIDEIHNCECKKPRLSQFQRSKDAASNSKYCKNQCINCNIEQDQSSDSYNEVVDTGTQYFKPPKCLMCFVKKYSVAPTVLEPVDFRMLNVKHLSPNIRNLQHIVNKAEVTSRHDENARPETSSKRVMVMDNRGDFVTDDSKITKRKKRFVSPIDVLQSYEMKKAVLELYAQKRVSQDGEKLVTQLPKFVYGRETDIDKLADRYYTDRSERNHVKTVKDR